FRGKSRRAGRGSYKEPGPRPALRREGDYDDARAEDYPSEGRVAGIGQATRQCQPSLQDDGVQPGQLLPVQRAVRQRWRVGVAGDQPQKPDPEEPHADRDRTGGGGAGDQAAGLGSGAHLGGTQAPRLVNLAGRRALCVAAPRSDVDETPPQGPRSQSGAGGILLTETQIVALEKAKADKEAHGEFESECPGYCGAQDTFYVGTLKGVGRVYQQTVIDTYAKVAFAKLYDRKTPITAAEILNDRVVPFYDEHGIRLSRMLTDRGTEFCGTQSHEYELYLAVEDIDHSRTKTKSPQTNGICERFHRTVLDEFYRIAFR